MLQLDSDTKDALSAIATSPYQMQALRKLADELRLYRVCKIKPPASLDQYGAVVGALAVLDEFLTEIERSVA